MIASLAGKLDRAAPGEVVVDVGGVGYRVHVSLATYASLPAPGQDCRLRVVTVVRDDEISLYGFATVGEEESFRLLQGVTGVGPRLALKILSGLSAEAFQHALAGADHAALQAIPGVGKKLAQRLVVELRDKVAQREPSAAAGLVFSGDRSERDALEALESLGYPRKTAQQALHKAKDTEASTLEGLVREALKVLAPRRNP